MKGKVTAWVAILLGVVMIVSGLSHAKRTMDPLVTTDWLAINLIDPNLVVLDIRGADEYAKGHIPGAVNIPFEVPVSAWIVSRDGLLLELPPAEQFFQTLGKAGITKDSKVVIVGRTTDPMALYAMANANRVAMTLYWAGVEDIAILDGGFDRWKWEGKAVSTEPATPKAVKFEGKVRSDFLVTKDYVKEKVGKSIIIDARDADVYFGVKTEPWSPRPGHIPTAKSLPTPWYWNVQKNYGMYRSKEELKEMVESLIGAPDPKKEIIVYCGVGGYASTAWYVISLILGYPNVKVYDGSAQEWTMDPNTPLVKYKWE
mgnify:CR=1 FL=1